MVSPVSMCSTSSFTISLTFGDNLLNSWNIGSSDVSATYVSSYNSLAEHHQKSLRRCLGNSETIVLPSQRILSKDALLSLKVGQHLVLLLATR